MIVVGVALLHHPPVLDDDQPVRQDQRVQRVVRDDQRGTRVFAEVPVQLGAGVQPGTGVQRGQRLVEQQQSRVDGERAGQRDPLRLAAGKLPGLAAGVPGQPDPLQPGGGLFPRGAPVCAVPARPERDVVQCGQMREQEILLEHDADRAALGGRPRTGCGAVQLGPGEGEVAGGQRLEAGQRPQRGGLSGAVRAEQRDHLARPDGQPEIQAERGPVGRTVLDHQVRVEQRRGVTGHALVSHLSRRTARMVTETTSRIRLSTIAACRSVSRAR